MFGWRRLTMLGSVLVLAGGCAAPVAMQVASVAADGLSVLTTGKGTTDHALSSVAGEDCRLANIMKQKPICRPHKSDENALVAAVDRPTRPAEGIAALVSESEIAAAAALAPAAGTGVRFFESPGMNMAEVMGAPLDATLTGSVDAEGTLHVFLVDGAGQAGNRALFTVPGYRHNPGAFTGVLMGERFVAPDTFVR